MSFIADLFTGGPSRSSQKADATLAGTENKLLGTDISSMLQRNNIVSSLFPQFESALSAFDPRAGLDPIKQALSRLAPQAMNFLSSATPDLNSAVNQIASAGPSFQQALSALNQVGPYLKSGAGMLNNIPGLVNQAQGQVNQMSPEIQALSDQLMQFMNLGSPYYQQAQRSSFEAGSNQFNNLAGQLREAIAQSGQGAAPSGLMAASMGDLVRNAGGTLAGNYLANLFNNENMQMQATGMFGQVPQLKGTQANLQTALTQPFLGGAQGFQGLGTAQAGVGQGFGAVGSGQVGQGAATSGVAGQRIGQGLGTAQVGSGILGTQGQLEQATQQDWLSKIQASSPIPALPQVPRSPSMSPIGPSPLTQAGGLLGGIGGLIGAL